MKNKFKKILLVAAGTFALSGVLFAQNVSLNMLVGNSGVVPLGGNGTLQATINATTGTSGQSAPVPSGKINLSITVPPSLFISATQNNIPAGWTIRNNDGTVINLCNNSTTIPVNTAVDILIDLQGVTATSGSPTMSGQISFKTNCSAPGSLSGDNLSDNSGQAGFSVSGTVPVRLTNFNAALINCQPVLSWTTENEINSSRFEIEKQTQNSSGWVLVGTVNSFGNSFSEIKYSFFDNSATASSGKVFYRLKMIDRDGHYKYSQILSILFNCDKRTLTVFPNPVKEDHFYISVNGYNEYIDANLLSLSGQIILKTKLKNGTSSIDVSRIANGIYVLQINPETMVSERIKVIVQH